MQVLDKRNHSFLHQEKKKKVIERESAIFWVALNTLEEREVITKPNN